MIDVNEFVNLIDENDNFSIDDRRSQFVLKKNFNNEIEILVRKDNCKRLSI